MKKLLAIVALGAVLAVPAFAQHDPSMIARRNSTRSHPATFITGAMVTLTRTNRADRSGKHYIIEHARRRDLLRRSDPPRYACTDVIIG
jgi:hypothetical protein